MKKFLNDPYDMVDEMVEAYVEVHGRLLRRLPQVRSVVRVDAPVRGKVGIVSGGGSGHKPAFIGYVGPGMLDGVAVGEIFTSPPPLAVLEAAKAVNGGAGVLFLLGNYSGDVMNFSLAAEMARAEGIEIAQCISTDDVASAPKGEEDRRRGVVGSVLCWKVGGAKAAAGGSLEECQAVVDKLNANTRTIGVALSPCTVPAKGTPTFTLADDEMEYGVGHHGEPGTAQIKMMSANDIAEKLARAIMADLPFHRGDDVALLINGLGGTPQIELYICYRQVAKILDAEGIRVSRRYVGEYFTGLEMAGFSVTLTRLDDELGALLDAPVNTPGWKIIG